MSLIKTVVLVTISYPIDLNRTRELEPVNLEPDKKER
ncbi:hypothetical protein Pla110_21320 [Polystyrenella longa]|uniref:Uncharacterized protein n=1 Tax=Polystyrenella longa TaxID=2528007 RepID=A0A518CMH5_9PLAN|nr:hypothetical protein Pla110_21320 [Polystyrenella longa]